MIYARAAFNCCLTPLRIGRAKGKARLRGRVAGTDQGLHRGADLFD